MQKLSLYIHFPYCLYKCHYCDFNSYAVKNIVSLQAPYVEALLQELEVAQRNFSLPKLTTIFLGGGTPSLFDPSSLKGLLDEIDRRLGISKDVEISLEVNPKTIHASRIQDYLSIGINRFSIGIQSFQDQFLSPLGRLHNGEEAISTLRLFEEQGVQNYSFDLMFGFPGQSLQDLQKDLGIALRFQPQHLSYYNLTLEEGTILAEHFRQGKIKLLENDLQASMYEEGIQGFQKAGFSLYEISNFAKKGFESKHNLSYWKYRDYLGLGAGAVSFLSKDLRSFPCQESQTDLYGLRWTNPKSPDTYIKNPGQAYEESAWEQISVEIARKEFWMMGLRLSEGIEIADFENKFGSGSLTMYEKVLQDLLQKEFLQKTQGKLHLTPRGRLLANEVVSCFFI